MNTANCYGRLNVQGGANGKGAPRGVVEVTECLNLREREGLKGSFEACRPVWRAELSGRGARLLCLRCDAAGAEYAIYACAEGLREVGFADDRLVWETNEEIYCAAVVGGELYVMASGGCRRFLLGADDDSPAVGNRRSTVWVAAGSGGEGCGFVAEAIAGGTVFSVVGERKLGKAYAFGETLTEADRKALCNDYAQGYEALVRQAAESGEMVQPCVVRLKCYDREGKLISTSNPVLLADPREPMKFGDVLRVKSGDRQTVYGYELTTGCWRVRLHKTGVSNQAVARVELCATPQSHPYHPDSEGTAYLLSRQSAGSGNDFSSVSLPGSASGLNGITGTMRLRMYGALCARMEELEKVVAVVYNPADEGVIPEDGLELQLLTEGNASSDSRAISRSLAKGIDAGTSKRERSNFIARCVAADGENVFWGNIMSAGAMGTTIDSLCAKFGSGSWEGYVAVDYRDGSRSVTKSSGTGKMPVAFGPSVYVGDPGVKEVTVALRSGGRHWRRIFVMSADASGEGAIWLSHDLKPVELPESNKAWEVPEAVKSPVWKPESIYSASAANPLNARTEIRLCGEVKELMLTTGGGNSWDFGRVPVTAFTGEGIYSVKLDNSREKMSSSIVYGAGVKSDACVTRGISGLYALTSKGLVKVEGTKAKYLLPQPERKDWCMITADHFSRGVLLQGAEDEGLTEWHEDSGESLTLSARADSSRGLVSATSGHNYFVSGNQLASTTREAGDAGEGVDVKWKGRFTLSDLPTAYRLGSLRLGLEADDFEGEIRLGVVTSEGEKTVFSTGMKGAVSHPAPIRFMMPPAKIFTLEVSGKARGKYLFTGFMIYDL